MFFQNQIKLIESKLQNLFVNVKCVIVSTFSMSFDYKLTVLCIFNFCAGNNIINISLIK